MIGNISGVNMIKQLKLYQVLAILIFLDIIITVIGVKYLGATELNPLCFHFDYFMIIKIVLSTVCIWTVYYYREDKYVHYAVIVSLLIYVVVVINNLWCAANYLYY